MYGSLLLIYLYLLNLIRIPLCANVKEISQIFVDPEISQVTEFKKQLVFFCIIVLFCYSYEFHYDLSICNARRMSIRGIPAYGPIDAIVPKMKEYGAVQLNFCCFTRRRQYLNLNLFLKMGGLLYRGS